MLCSLPPLLNGAGRDRARDVARILPSTRWLVPWCAIGVVPACAAPTTGRATAASPATTRVDAGSATGLAATACGTGARSRRVGASPALWSACAGVVAGAATVRRRRVRLPIDCGVASRRFGRDRGRLAASSAAPGASTVVTSAFASTPTAAAASWTSVALPPAADAAPAAAAGGGTTAPAERECRGEGGGEPGSGLVAPACVVAAGPRRRAPRTGCLHRPRSPPRPEPPAASPEKPMRRRRSRLRAEARADRRAPPAAATGPTVYLPVPAVTRARCMCEGNRAMRMPRPKHAPSRRALASPSGRNDLGPGRFCRTGAPRQRSIDRCELSTRARGRYSLKAMPKTVLRHVRTTLCLLAVLAPLSRAAARDLVLPATGEAAVAQPMVVLTLGDRPAARRQTLLEPARGPR